MGDENMVTVQV